MTDIFLSYANEDRDAAQRIVRALEAEGFSVAWDHPILPGKWTDVVEEGIERARCCVVLWSQHAVASNLVMEQAALALEYGKFIPVQLDESVPPAGFRRTAAVDLKAWTGDISHPGWARLSNELRRLLDTPNGHTGGDPPSYQPSASPQRRATGARLLGMSTIVGGGIAIAIGALALLPRVAPTEIVAEAPTVSDPGASAEIERLQRERAESVARAERERQQLEADRANAARLAERQHAEAALRAEEQRRLQAARPSVNLSGTTWNMRRRFTNTEPRTWADVGTGTFRSGGEYFSHGSTDGFWRVSGATLTFGFAGGNQTTYTATLRANRMTGTFRNARGEEGEFELTIVLE